MEKVLVENVVVSDDQLVLFFTSGINLEVPLEWFPTLLRARRKRHLAKLRNWRLVGGGEGVHWEELDEDISVPNLVVRAFGFEVVGACGVAESPG